MSRVTSVVLSMAATLIFVVAPASADEVTAASGTTEALLRWEPDENGFLATGIRLTVSRQGSKVIDAEPVVDERFVVLRRTPSGGGPLSVADLDGDGEPEVLVTLFSGGASCCVMLRVYRFADATYTPSALLQLGPTGFRLVQRESDGRPVLVSATEHWHFGSHACASLPLRVLAYDAGTFTDVTREPSMRVRLRADARHWQRKWRRQPRCDGRPSLDHLAAYVVDLHRLGRPRRADAAVRAARRRGAFARVTERAFRRQVSRFLAALDRPVAS